MWWIILILGFLLLILIMVIFELFSPRIKKYAVIEKRIENPLRLIMISDLHGRKSFLRNKRFFERLEKNKPDEILLAGDMITTRRIENYHVSYEFIKKLSEIAPVYYAIGNHEGRCMNEKSPYHQPFMSYLNKVKKLKQVYVLDNEMTKTKLAIGIYGLNIEMKYYENKGNLVLEEDDFWSKLPLKIDTMPVILLAHNPKFMDLYFRWGADYILSGHYHGGMVRLPFVGGLISPEFKLFPKYNGGHYQEGHQHGFVTRGIGTHTIHFRLFNRCEVIQLDLVPNDVTPNKQE